MDTHLDRKTGLFLPGAEPSGDGPPQASEAVKASRLVMYNRSLTHCWRIPLRAVCQRLLPDGTTSYPYTERAYYLRNAGDRIRAAFTAVGLFGKWERTPGSTEEWPQVACDVEAEPLTEQEFARYHKEALDNRWGFKRVQYLLPREEHPRLPVAFTYITDSTAAFLQDCPDQFVNIDNAYKVVKA